MRAQVVWEEDDTVLVTEVGSTVHVQVQRAVRPMPPQPELDHFLATRPAA